MTPTRAQIEAVRRVVERCNKRNKGRMHIPVSGATAMEWLLEELIAQCGCGYDRPDDICAIHEPIVRRHVAAAVERCEKVARDMAAKMEAHSYQDEATRLAIDMLHKAAAAIRASQEGKI